MKLFISYILSYSNAIIILISDIAETCLFLASNKSSYVTGATIEVTGEAYRITNVWEKHILFYVLSVSGGLFMWCVYNLLSAMNI